jgi:hypothetical protein
VNIKMKKIIQTDNPVLRLWGNTCGYIADFFLGQTEKYGDLYEVEDFLHALEKLDDTFAWKDDE